MLSFSHEDNQIDNPNLYDCDLLSNEESLEPWEIKPEIDLEDPKYKNLKHALQFAEMDYYVFPVPLLKKVVLLFVLAVVRHVWLSPSMRKVFLKIPAK